MKKDKQDLMLDAAISVVIITIIGIIVAMSIYLL